MDRAVLKAAVVWVYLAGMAQTGLALLDLHNVYLGRFFGEREKITEIRTDHLWLSITASTAAVAVVIQSLYAYRIYLISKKRWLTILIICMSLGQLASGILGTICYTRTASYDQNFGFTWPNFELLYNHTCEIGFDWVRTLYLILSNITRR
ncbi:hypothetical protein Agabi119p4_6829 [Agaricus bisporus var. burnettii]|uniref:Uncharacterized protein n=1 Tax=Agaricus bisporus var. burnettii TaxID=192524 RepID=A0A8H7KF17_AGABI|nr:hypothetical protein Agabi119p4_6829 [Agaricus bisporus var. burnettii]